jgi:hypothetical protein
VKARLAALLALVLAAPARADEGMWMPQQLPDLAPRLAELGFDGDAKRFAELTDIAKSSNLLQELGAPVQAGGH